MKKPFWFLSALIMVSIVAFPASGQFSIMGGYSKITSSGNDFFSGGPYVSGLGLIQVAKGLHVGLWNAYHLWGLLESIIIGPFFGTEITLSNSQIFPCLRYEFVQTGKFRPYLHIASGLSVMRATGWDESWDDWIDHIDGSETRFGGNVGIGARILVSGSISIEAMGLVNVHFNQDGGTTNWLNVGLGINFGL